VPLLASLVDEMCHETGQWYRHDFFHAVAEVNPMAQLVLTAEGSSRCSDLYTTITHSNPWRKTPYNWPSGVSKTVGDTTLEIFLISAGYGVATLVLLRLAAGRVRR